MEQLIQDDSTRTKQAQVVIAELLQSSGAMPVTFIEVVLAVIIDHSQSVVLDELASQYARLRELVVAGKVDQPALEHSQSALADRVSELTDQLQPWRSQVMAVVRDMVREGVLTFLPRPAYDGSVIVVPGANYAAAAD